MFFLKSLYCRIFQTAFRIALPFLPYREPDIVNSCAELEWVFKKEGSRSALIVTDGGIVKSGLLTPLEKVLTQSGISFSVYDKTQPNPTEHNVEEALTLYKADRCDTLIAIGGGSSMDCAKAIGARVAYPNRRIGQMKGILRVLRQLPTLIAIPTTAGTGSEATLAAIITDSENHHKYALMSFPLIPHYAVLDAELTRSLPPQVTATTGMDALTHAVEAYIGRSTTAETRRLSIEAAKLIFDNIEAAYRLPDCHRARENMLLAAYKAGIAFSRSYVGYVHAIAHSLGGQYGIPHGLANAVILPYMLTAYGKSAEKKLHRLADAVGIAEKGDSDRIAAEKFINALRELNRRMAIPEKLGGIKKEDIPKMSRHAEKEANPLYPVPRLMTRRELAEFYLQISEKE